MDWYFVPCQYLMVILLTLGYRQIKGFRYSQVRTHGRQHGIQETSNLERTVGHHLVAQMGNNLNCLFHDPYLPKPQSTQFRR